MRDGLMPICKSCTKRQLADARDIRRASRPQAREGMKVCPRYQQEKPASRDFFYYDRRRADGLSGMCISCRSQTESPAAAKILPASEVKLPASGTMVVVKVEGSTGLLPVWAVRGLVSAGVRLGRVLARRGGHS